MTEAPSPAPASFDVRWLASYPKSGNTWVRFLLYQYFHGKAEASLDVARFIPGIHGRKQVRDAKLFDGALFAKTHFPYGPDITGRGRAIGCIYVVRHPRDVILSCLNYARLTGMLGDSQGITDEMYVRSFLQLGGASEYFRHRFGTFENHYRSWLDQRTVPTILVRYEDLKADPSRELSRILEFLGHAPDPAKIEQSVALSTFERLQAMEMSEKASGSEQRLFVGSAEQMKKGRMFMNKGQSGRSLDPIAAGLDRAVEERFADAIKRFGY